MARAWCLVLLGFVVSLVAADGIYSKDSPVLQVNTKNYGSLIAQSNYTSVRNHPHNDLARADCSRLSSMNIPNHITLNAKPQSRFYAPWCGHCQNLKPAYEKAAKNLAGLAKVAAVNCDEEANKPLCGEMGVQGFPTLKIVKPGTKRGRPVVEDYQGQRSTKAIVDAVVDKIPNHVKKLQDSNLDEWLADTTTPAKAILFTEKGTTSALIRSLAIDFLGNVGVGQIRSKEEAAVEKYGISQFPSIVLLPGKGQDPVVYTDDMKKELLVNLFTQVAPPNPDPAPIKEKAAKPSKSAAKKSSSASSSFSRASKSHKSSDLEDFIADKTIVLNDDTPTESPLPIVEQDEKPMVVPQAFTAIPQLSTAEELDQACLTPKSGTCMLVLLPISSSPDADLPGSAIEALAGFAEILDKHSKRRDHTFPFYAIPANNARASTVRSELGLKESNDLEIIAINNKRSWWKHYANLHFGTHDLENFVDAIKFGEGTKSKLPDGFGSNVESSSTTASESNPMPQPEQEPEPIDLEDAAPTVADPEPAGIPQPDHDEL